MALNIHFLAATVAVVVKLGAGLGEAAVVLVEVEAEDPVEAVEPVLVPLEEVVVDAAMALANSFFASLVASFTTFLVSSLERCSLAAASLAVSLATFKASFFS